MKIYNQQEDFFRNGYLDDGQQHLLASIAKEVLKSEEALLAICGFIEDHWKDNIIKLFLSRVGYYDVTAEDLNDIKTRCDLSWFWDDVDEYIFEVLNEEFCHYKSHEISDGYWYEYHINVTSKLEWPSADICFEDDMKAYLDK